MTHSRTDTTQTPIVAALRAVGALVIPVNKQRDAGFDILVIFNGGVYLVEIKAPGKLTDLTPNEVATMNAVCHQGVAYWVITTAEDAVRMVGR
jgi:hypothetical protein